jgi:2-polyprenyl-6-hydroxyphenyl methylase/3-demethylubiquinone-9 3-methyltransferase
MLADSGKTPIEGFFDAQSEGWTQLYHTDRHFSRRYKVLTSLMQAELHGVKPGLALDAGCGTGVFSVFLAELGWQVEAIDASSRMIDTARRYCESRMGTQAGSVTLRRAEIEDLRLPNATFDLVLCLSTLEYVREDLAALESLVRVLRPGGRLVISIPNRGGLVRRIEALVGRVRHRPEAAYLQLQSHQRDPQEIDAFLLRSGLAKERDAFWSVGATLLEAGRFSSFFERPWWAGMYGAAYVKKATS